MFLRSLIDRNPTFIEVVAALHREGAIPANSYVLDLETIGTNTAALTDRAHALGLEVLAMTKQIGRVAPALSAIRRGGADGFVAVDMEGARAIFAAGMNLGHLGHLVQVPRHQADEAAAMEPGVWTVFSLDKAREADAAAGRMGRTQDVLVRIHAPGDIFYPGHEGGFPAQSVVEVAEAIEGMDNVRFAGITTFPALLFEPASQSVVPTANLGTLERARTALESAGHKELIVNAPGTTSSAVLHTLADAGATQVEPGHGLTATTPLHAVSDLVEDPAMLYLSEVSHIHEGRSYFFGGGLYVDPVFEPYEVTALAGGKAQSLSATPPLIAELPPPTAIDYYGQLRRDTGRDLAPGDTVILGFRAQAFFTRAFVVPVSGVSTARPAVEGIWTSDGRPVSQWQGAL